MANMKTAIAPPSFPVRCVIVVPGQNVEVPVFFNSWIYGGAENDIDEQSQNNRYHILRAAVPVAKGRRTNRVKPKYNRYRLEPKLSSVAKKR